MKSKRKICVVTGTRAEYGLLYWIMESIKDDPALELQIIVTGMHLSSEFGMTYTEIEKDGFDINKKVEILLSSDTSIGISKSIGLGLISFCEAYADLQPDIVLVLGDRFEIFSAVAAAMISKLVIAHCHGGEATEGLIDEPIRHSITKMSHLHFTATDEYRKRVIQLGEQPDKVYNFGALGIENINRLKFFSKDELEVSLNFILNGKPNILVTFHPVTLENSTSEKQMKELLSALQQFNEAKIIFTKANADTDGRIINNLIEQYVRENPNQSIVFSSLGQLRYLSTLKYIDLVVGNSSSGLIEVPSFRKPTINIGDRQKGRIKASSVIDCKPDKVSITGAIEKALTKDFQKELLKVSNPYGIGNSSEKIVRVIKEIDISDILKKEFYNVNYKL